MREITITVPKGYEIDKENSTFEKIVFKEIVPAIVKTWEEIVTRKIANKEKVVYINDYNEAQEIELSFYDDEPIEELKDILPDKRTAERIVALCQMFIIAEHYNDGWKPNWSDTGETKFYLLWNNTSGCIMNAGRQYCSLPVPFFKSSKILDEAYSHNKEIFETALKP